MKTHMTMDPAALAIAKKLKENRLEGQRQMDELKERYEREADELDKKFKEAHQNLWLNLTNTMKLAPSDEENGFGYEMETKYVEEHGILFLQELNPEDSDCDCPGCRALRKGGERPMSLAEILGMAGDD